MPRKPERPPSPFWTRLSATIGNGRLLGQTEVAKAFGMAAQSSVQAWYYGESLPPLETVETMSERGHTTIDYLAYGRLPRVRVRPGSDLNQLLQIWTALSEDGRQHVLETAKNRLARETSNTGTVPTLSPDEVANLLREKNF